MIGGRLWSLGNGSGGFFWAERPEAGRSRFGLSALDSLRTRAGATGKATERLKRTIGSAFDKCPDRPETDFCTYSRGPPLRSGLSRLRLLGDNTAMMLDVTDRDIAALNDTDLRALVARMVEATLRSRGLPTVGITWSGDQNAPDGGLDIRVELRPDAALSGFVPRSSTGFQVKKSAMGPAAIRAEMSPRGTLRGSIAELAERGGAYILVSSGSNVSDSALTARRRAMQLAVAAHPSANRLTLDFYDRQRLATWVRDFPALSPWVLVKAGRPMQGWRSYESWTATGAGAPTEFVVDETARLFDGTGRPGGPEAGMPILAGLQRMRTVLARPGASARFVGLSGVGKTRLVEALFDDRIGTDALDPARVIYTDLGAHPEPSPATISTYLLNRHVNSILIVDNCPAELHRQLTEICRVPGSKVSVLTVEYDIREDSPEGTEVFRLEAASAELVAKVVRAHYPRMSQVDAGTIGAFSGGNARVGLALAHTLRSGESVSGLPDEALFERLFRQRHPDDVGLLASAEACALVYSFDGESIDSEDSELVRLAILAGCLTTTLHRHVAELSRRGLLQMRGRWRAVLPHAIANRLAKRALENIPRPQIDQQLVAAPARLLKSFSRRLGYLHDSKIARRIVQEWLSPSGLLGAHIGNLSPLGIVMLVNVAPVAPESVLSAIERVRLGGPDTTFFTISNPHRDEFVQLLRKVAYDADLFERCAALLVLFALAARDAGNERRDATLEVWRSLFSPFLSGTHASVVQRLRVIEALLRGDTPGEHLLAVEALTAALETFHFSSTHDFDFGSRSRDYGYHPTTRMERTAWFSACIHTAMKVGVSAASSAPIVREAFARQLPGLWVYTSTQDVIEEAVQAFAAEGFWADGSVAIKEALWRCRGQPADQARLQALAIRLGPKTLEQNIRLQVLRDQDWIPDSDDAPDGIAKAIKQADDRAEELGRRLAAEAELLDQLLPAIMERGNGRRWWLARGLARAENDRLSLWLKLVDAIASAGDDANSGALLGYLSAWRELDPDAVRSVLDAAVNNPKLIRRVPELEAAAGLDGSSAERLHRALAAGTPVWAFKILVLGRLTDSISTVDLSSLVSAIATAPDGWEIAVDILAMRLRSDAGDRTNFDLLLELGRDLLLKVDTTRKSHKQMDYGLETLASVCLAGAAGQPVAAAVCQSLAGAFGSRAISFYDLQGLVRALFRVQPTTALDAFSQPPPEHRFRYPTVLSMFEEISRHIRHPILEIGDEVVLKWCAEDPGRNFVAAATSIPYSRTSSDGAGSIWTEVALKLLERAPEPCDVLRAFIARFSPHSWSGSRAAIVEANAHLLTVQEESGNSGLADLARQERERLLSEAREERRLENERSRREDERFE